MKLRHQLMFDPAAIFAQRTIADALASHLPEAKPPCPADILRIGKPDAQIDDLSLGESKQAWEKLRLTNLTDHKTAGQDWYGTVVQAAVRVYRELNDLPPLRFKAIPFDNERMRFLTKEDPDRLIASYTPHVQPDHNNTGHSRPPHPNRLADGLGVNGIDMERNQSDSIMRKMR